MADDLDAAPADDGSDPFAKYLSGSAAPPAPHAPVASPTDTSADAEGPDPFASFLQPKPEDETSPGGAYARSFERGVAPAVGSLVGEGIGGVVGSIGGPVGTVAGAVAGSLGGAYVVDRLQSDILHALPDSWQDVLGGDDRQQQLDQQYQPTASFLGGLTPYAMTLSPMSALKSTVKLPENATAWQHIMANPITARLFGGGVMGGMEAGQEAAEGQQPNWTNIAIATGFGTVFNRPNRIGETLTGAGRAVVSPSPRSASAPAVEAETAPAVTPAGPEPTVAQAGDAKVMGPGITEDVFMGTHQQAPDAAMQAQDAARTEQAVLNPTPAPPDIHAVVQRMEPELIGHYDALGQQYADIQAHRDNLTAPIEPGAAEQPPSPEAQSNIAQLDKQLQAISAERDALAPQVSAAYRRAADAVGAGVVEPEPQPVPSPAPATPEITPEINQFNAQSEQGVTQPSPAASVSPQVQEQAAAIAASMAQQWIAAGRPPEEAEALGRVEASRIVQRSRRMNGALGNPLDLYNAQGADIQAGGAYRAPIPAIEAEPAIDPAAARATAESTGQAKLIEKLIGRGASNKEIADTIGRKLSENEVAAFRTTVPAKPPLMPTAEQPEIGRPEEMSVAQEQTPPQAEAAQEVAPRQASEIEALDPKSIGVDAKRFQFKAGGDEAGVTERLQGIEKWDARLAGTALVFRDADGKNWIADGHQRLALANRLTDAGQEGIKLNAFVLNAEDGITDSAARSIAAVKNIAEGTGSAIDAAKVIRESKESGIDLPPLPPRSTLVRDGNALAELSPDAFGIVVNEVVPSAQGAIVGRLVKDPAEQVEALRLLAKVKPENARQAEMIVRDMLGSGTEQMTRQDSLFGDEAFAGSVVLERAKVADEALKQLRKDKATFGTLVKESDRIVGAGQNVLDRTANESRLTADEKASDILTQLAFRAGPVSDALSDVARRLKAGDISATEAARDFLGVVRGAIESGVDTGADARGAVAGPAGERQELATEPGAEGLPQTLIPGVAPITDAQRAQLEANRPLTGGEAAPGGLFDEDAQNQRTLFQPAYHGSPHIFDRFSNDKIGTGEGAQAYGHGLYFAGKKAVAEWYRDALTKGGKIPDPVMSALREADNLGFDTAGQALSAIRQHSDWVDRWDARSLGEEKIAAIQHYIDNGNKGRLYHVDVPEEHELLDWDKPLSEQPEGVREKLAALGVALKPIPKIGDPEVGLIFRQAMRQVQSATDDDDVADVLNTRDVIDNDQNLYNHTVRLMKRAGANPADVSPGYWIAEQARPHIQAMLDNQKLTGEQIYNDLGKKLLAERPQEERGWNEQNDKKTADVLATEKLREAGIPGHKYIGHESQATNYVIYDDSRVSIQNYEQGKRGSVTFKEGAKPILKVFQEANASTGIHELGHIWLEDTLHDAVHPAANDELRADGEKIRRNLGMTDDQTTPLRKQHEQFARWAEQYLREGIAPSPELAGVFAKFKNWLTQIYQTIKGLGAPINDEMRGVFDRLLSAEPNRTVIAPEKPIPPGVADLHETDAATVQPHEAEPAMDRVMAERDSAVAEQRPEIQNEIAGAEQRIAAADAVAGGENPASASGPEPLVEGGVGPGTKPAGNGGGVERSPVVSGGAETRPEGVGVPAGGNPGGSNGDAGLRDERSQPAGAAGSRPGGANGIAPDAGTVFGAKESPFIDRAGNIRLDTLTTNADVAKAIHAAADANNDFIGERRGVVTDGQVMELADALGMDFAELSTRKIGQAFNAEQVMAARKLLIQSATTVSAAMKKAADGTDEDVMAYAEAKARHQMIQGQVAGITAEAGRALRAFRNITGQGTAQTIDQIVRNSTAKTLFQLKAEAKLGALLDTPGDVSKFTRDASKPDFWDGVLEYWTNALISNPNTHATYAIGTEMLSLMKAVPETAMAAAIGAVRRAGGREGEVVHLAEVAAQLRAHIEAVPSAANAAAQALQTGTTTLLPGEKGTTLPFQPKGQFAPHGTLNEAYRYSDVLPDVFGVTRGILDGSIVSGYLTKLSDGEPGAPAVAFQRSQTGVIPNLAIRGVTAILLGEAARLPSRGVGAIHSFFRATNYSMEKARLAVRQAAEEGLSGTEFDARVADLRQNPTPQMMEQARSQANELTLMGQGSEFVQALSRLTNKRILGVPLLKFIDPFVKIGGNVIDQAIVQRTPLGLLSPELRADLMGKNGNIAQDTAGARMLVGTGLAIGFGALAARGAISGSGPSDPRQGAMWRLAGNQAHSIRIGDTWYSVGHLGPMGMLMGISADMYDVAHLASEGQMLTAAATLQHAITQNILDQSFMRGPADAINAIDNPGTYGQSYLRNFISSFVPYSSAMAQMVRSSDPYSRQARSVMDAIKQKIPGQSETLMPRRDIWGQPLPNLPSFGGLTAIYEAKVNSDPVDQAMLNLGIYPAQPDRAIRGVRLTDQQYDLYSQYAGRMAKMQLDRIVSSPDFRTWAPETKVDVVNETIRQSRETARGAVMARWPQIAADATRSKMRTSGGQVQ